MTSQESVKTRLGDILLKKGLISDEQLQSAIDAQKSSHLQLGEILIGMQCVSQRQINRALNVQSKLRNAVLTSILSLSPIALVGCGSGSDGVAAEKIAIEEVVQEVVDDADEEVVEESEPAIVGAANLSWSIPALRTDGSDLELHEVDSYRVYQVSSNGDSDTVHEVEGTDTTITIENLAQGEYSFSITVVDIGGLESGFSETISLTI